MNIPSPLPGRTFFQVRVRLPWKKASSAPLGTETGKGNHNFANVVRFTPYFKVTGRLPSLYYLFQSAVGHSSRTQNTFYRETKHRGPIILPSCGHVIFYIFCVKQPTYANVSRFTDCREPYIYFHFQSAFDKSTLLIDSIQWLFSAVCLALNAGEETATSNRCYLLYFFKLCLSNHTFIKQFHCTTYSAWGVNGA